MNLHAPCIRNKQPANVGLCTNELKSYWTYKDTSAKPELYSSYMDGDKSEFMVECAMFLAEGELKWNDS